MFKAIGATMVYALAIYGAYKLFLADRITTCVRNNNGPRQ